MKKTKKLPLAGLAFVVFLLALFSTCDKKETNTPPPCPTDVTVVPQPFPGKSITGINFPEDSTTIYSWLAAMDTVKIAQHAWGIWAGLTNQTDQVYGCDALLVYDTWLGTSELQTLMKDKTIPVDCNNISKSGRTGLETPGQFHHAASFASLGNAQSSSSTIDTTLWVTVNYSPDAACYALDKDIYNTKVLANYAPADTSAIGSIPAFPSTSITIKPTYFTLKNKGSELLAVPVWPGQPNPARNISGFNHYWEYVYVDPTNSQVPNKPLVPTPTSTATGSALANATVNLSDFINFTIDSTMAAYINQQQGSVQGVKAEPGDLAILMGMHVGTKEIANWTWQTFFWAPNPATPPFPSSTVYASNRPMTLLSPQAAHYAVVPVYNMVWPNQPINGGTNVGARANVGYNPYLEPGLDTIAAIPNRLDPNYMWGVQSNCMTCHSLAAYKLSDGKKPDFRYSADQYISMDDSSIFGGYIQLDFAWSIDLSLYTP